MRLTFLLRPTSTLHGELQDVRRSSPCGNTPHHHTYGTAATQHFQDILIVVTKNNQEALRSLISSRHIYPSPINAYEKSLPLPSTIQLIAPDIIIVNPYRNGILTLSIVRTTRGLNIRNVPGQIGYATIQRLIFICGERSNPLLVFHVKCAGGMFSLCLFIPPAEHDHGSS